MEIVLLLLLLANARALSVLPKKPNIIFVHVDSMDGRTALPDSPALTPNIDRLASRGVRFDNTYCASPECVPSRSALWSGRRTDQTGAWSNGHGLPPNYPIIMDHVADNGYDTLFISRHDFLSGHHSLSANLSSWTRAVPNFAILSESHPQADITRCVTGKHLTSVSIGYKTDSKMNQQVINHSCSVVGSAFLILDITLQSIGTPRVSITAAVTIPTWLPEDQMHPVQR